MKLGYAPLHAFVLMGLLHAGGDVSAASAAALSPPSALHAVSAGAHEIQLEWTARDPRASGYVVERRVPGASGYVRLRLAAASPSAADASVQPSVLYSYRVRAVAGADTSSPSNEIRVGPPPAGYSLAARAPAGREEVYGAQTSLALDTLGDPMVAFIDRDPNLDGGRKDGQLYFVAWDRAAWRWKAPVEVAHVGDVRVDGVLSQVSLSCDPSTGALGIAYQVAEYRLELALSKDGGATWAAHAVDDAGDRDVDEPSLVLRSGRAHLAYHRESAGVIYVTGPEGGDPAQWKPLTAPGLPDPSRARAGGLSLAVDSAGAPGVAYWLDSKESDGASLAFWRPGGGAASRVVGDARDLRKEPLDLRLAFRGRSPCVAFTARREGATDRVWLAVGADSGSADSSSVLVWRTPVAVPDDGRSTLGGHLALAIGSDGRAAVAAERVGGSPVDELCGEPKLARSTDLATWATCSPAGTEDRMFQAATPSLAAGPDGRLYLAIQNRSAGGRPGPGVLVWREP